MGLTSGAESMNLGANSAWIQSMHRRGYLFTLWTDAPARCSAAAGSIGGILRSYLTMNNLLKMTILLGSGLLLAPAGLAQLGMFSNEQRIALTSEWKGERTPDGRPRVPDAILERMKTVSAEEAWAVLKEAKYDRQFEGDWKVINPGRRLVGRVVTAQFMPARPDLNAMINKNAAAEGRVGRGQNSWVIDTLQPNDVLVVDLFGKIVNGTFAGDNLATSIYTKSKTGLVVNGAVRDLTGIQEINGFMGYVRDFHPSAIADVALTGINVPIRIGQVTVLPGDVLVSDPEGLTFVPPHLAEKVVEYSERTQLRDDWGHQMLREGKYTPGQIDGKWTQEMEAEFDRFVEKKKAR
jgi:4-hydroxy-4-methyl-2-oxoglutarate aldolase